MNSLKLCHNSSEQLVMKIFAGISQYVHNFFDNKCRAVLLATKSYSAVLISMSVVIMNVHLMTQCDRNWIEW
jgi:hypothetical protein